jgi:hypothetical protein
MTLHQNQNASEAAKDWIENGAAYTRISAIVEQGREDARIAAIRATAPPLSFLDEQQ